MFTAGHQLLTILNAIYEGGTIKFIEDGGKVLPYPDDDGAFIYHPCITEDLTKKLMQYNTNKYHIQVVSKLNEYTMSELWDFTQELQRSSILCAVNPYHLVIYLTFHIGYDSYIYHKVTDLIRKCLPKVQRVAFIFTNKTKIFVMAPSMGIKVKSPMVETKVYPIRDTTIQQDEILNLKIELALCDDVQHFIDNL